MDNKNPSEDDKKDLIMTLLLLLQKVPGPKWFKSAIVIVTLLVAVIGVIDSSSTFWDRLLQAIRGRFVTPEPLLSINIDEPTLVVNVESEFCVKGTVATGGELPSIWVTYTQRYDVGHWAVPGRWYKEPLKDGDSWDAPINIEEATIGRITKDTLWYITVGVADKEKRKELEMYWDTAEQAKPRPHLKDRPPLRYTKGFFAKVGSNNTKRSSFCKR